MHIRTWKMKWYHVASTILLMVTPMVSLHAFIPLTDASTAASVSFPFTYNFSVAGTLNEASSSGLSSSPYWWLNSGGYLTLQNGVGNTVQGSLSANDPWRVAYAAKDPIDTDNGYHPQNLLEMLFRTSIALPNTSVYVKRNVDNLSNVANRHPWNGESMLAGYQDQNNYYYAGIRNDGDVVIKKKTNGVYQTLAETKIFSGTYNATTNPDLIPLNKWIGMKFVVATDSHGYPDFSFSTDVGQTGTWTLAAHAVDDPTKFGPAITAPGLIGFSSDYADASFDNFSVSNVSTIDASYDATVLNDNPVMYLTMGSSSSGSESDRTGHGHNGSYQGGVATTASLPNGDTATDFNGSSQYLTVPSSSALSISTTKQLTWEAWIRPDTLQFPQASSGGYVDWMGKCDQYSPTCEWESRMYSASTSQNRPSRLSAYVFNPSAGLGSAADWQPNTGVVQAGKWLHVVGEYQTQSTPSGCSASYPGSINIWVNGVEWNASYHLPTGCMSQYSISPRATSSALNIGTMALDTWFKGAVGKVAVYDYLLSPTQINAHYQAMTGSVPVGSCANSCTTALISGLTNHFAVADRIPPSIITKSYRA